MEAWWGHLPLCPFKRGQRWRRCLFITVSYVISWFIKIDLKQIDTAVWARGKFRLSFYNFGYYFFGQHCWWTETNLFGNDFFVFFEFPLPSLFHCSPCFTAAPESLNMRVVSTNFAKILICKREYDVILWRQKQCISNNNDHYTPLLNTRIWEGGIQSSSRPGHHQTSARHWARYMNCRGKYRSFIFL